MRKRPFKRKPIVFSTKPEQLPENDTTIANTNPESNQVENLWADTFGRLGTRAAQGILILSAVAIIIYGMVTLSVVVIPILIATILACALQPAVNFLERKRFSRLMATVTTLLVGAVAFLGVGALVVSGVANEWGNLAKEVTNGIHQVTAFLSSGNLPIDKTQISDMTNTVMGFFTSAQFGSGALAGIGSAFTVITGLALTLVVMFFFIKDGPIIWHFLLQPFHPAMHAKLERIGEHSVKVLGGYITGTTIVALVDALLIGVALWILQVPLALPLALVVFIGAYIPIVGATLAGTIAALVTLVTNDLNAAIIVVAVVIGVNQLEGNFLAPVVLGNALKLHALVILLALSIGAVLGGIIGTLLAVPIAAVLWAALKAWRADSPPLWAEAKLKV